MPGLPAVSAAPYLSDIQSEKSGNWDGSRIFSDIQTELTPFYVIESDFSHLKPCFFGLYETVYKPSRKR